MQITTSAPHTTDEWALHQIDKLREEFEDAVSRISSETAKVKKRDAVKLASELGVILFELRYGVVSKVQKEIAAHG